MGNSLPAFLAYIQDLKRITDEEHYLRVLSHASFYVQTLHVLIVPSSLFFLQMASCQPTTYRSCSNPNDSDENERNQHVAHRHFPIRCGRGWSSAAVHRTRSLSRYRESE